jgi:hypothetical protein
MTEQITIHSEVPAIHSQKNVHLNFSALPLPDRKGLPGFCVVEAAKIVSNLGPCSDIEANGQPATGLGWKMITFPAGRL